MALSNVCASVQNWLILLTRCRFHHVLTCEASPINDKLTKSAVASRGCLMKVHIAMTLSHAQGQRK